MQLLNDMVYTIHDKEPPAMMPMLEVGAPDKYEDLDAAIKKISEFFGYSVTEEQVRLIANKGTFKSMKEKSTQTYGYFGQIIFRKGDVGDWKNNFTEAQNQEMDAKFEVCLAGTKLGEMMNYSVHCK
ncbi:hypothetical protein FKM82_010609 [Ascaphus truei]